MLDCNNPLASLGRLPRRLDPLGQIANTPNPRLHLRFVEGGEGEGAGGDGGDGAGDGLGDAGKQAIDRMKAERNAARAEAKEFKDLGLTVEQIRALKEGSGNAPTDDDIEKRIKKAVDTATAAATAEATAKSNARTRAAEVRAQAAELGFIKPTQALALLNADELAKVTVTDDGDADAAAVKKLLEDLSKDSPHLLKTSNTPGHRDAGIGARGAATAADAVRPGTDRMRNAYEASSKK